MVTLYRSMSLNKSEVSWEGTNLSQTTWKQFIDSDIWKALLFEFESREKYLIELFKESDREWPPEVIKGKLTEIDFFRQLPILVLVSVEDKNKKEIENVQQDG